MFQIEDKLEKTAVVIAARSGSKGLSEKNIKPILGVPLLAWSIRYAQGVGLKPIVSTDSDKYASIARKYGGLTPFLRPESLASDSTESAPVVLHAIDYFESETGQKFEYVLLLEPTSPIRRSSLVRDALSMLRDGVESVVSVQKAGNAHPNFALKRNNQTGGSFSVLNGQPTLRRQLMDPVFYPDGSLYLSSIKTLREQRSFYHASTALLEVDSIESLDIDDQQSFALVEFFMTQIIEQPDNPLFDSFLWMKNDY